MSHERGRKLDAKLAAIFALAAAVLIAADQWTKVLAQANLEGRGLKRLVGDLAVLVFTWNSGAFLSLGSGLPPLFRSLFLLVLPTLILLGLGAYLIKRNRGKGSSLAELAAAALLVAGGIGNLIDRLLFGAVRDFLNFGIGKLRTGIMNLADLYILAALILLMITMLGEGKSGDKGGAKPKGGISDEGGPSSDEGS